MKNITVKVDEATYHHARVRAAEAGTSVSVTVRDFLNGQVEAPSNREARRVQAMEEFFAVAEAQAEYNRKPVEPVRREEIHEEATDGAFMVNQTDE
ncbi:MAG: hypothetical protein MK080_04145 [Opitutales bacterium]|nr:hypothetical protein [Opitutales bacterium]